ncbi:chemotaxis protein CheA [Rhizobium sp. CRIBSB]|nr:chemotaxis protein CheA [Rhizobium sp. CRIBSB]
MDPMEAIRATFFQECDELLADLEAGLLKLESGEGDADTVNAVFRAVHSVKGGAGAFALESLVRFAHVFETTLDALRNGVLAPSPDVVRPLLRASDRLADHVSSAKQGMEADPASDVPVVAELQALLGSEGVDESPDADLDFEFQPMVLSLGADPVPATDGGSDWRIDFRPLSRMYRNANEPLLLVRELARLGPVKVTADLDRLPGLDQFDPLEAYVGWSVELGGADLQESVIRDVFEFVEGDCDLTIQRVSNASPVPALSQPEPEIERELSFEEVMALATGRSANLDLVDVVPTVPDEAPVVAEPIRPTVAAVSAEDASARPASAEPPAQTTIRVDLERVDRLIDLVGELVINQAMLNQQVMESGVARSSNIALGLEDLEAITREIQDSVMAIRAQPVKSVFQRMPRLVREVAAMTGKQVRLVTEGEGTEVDKTVIERLSDPLTHMIRNAIDHGLETPENRIKAGKPAEGVIRLSAQHRSGRVVIVVSDDGRGINRERVRSIAVERRLIEPDAALTDEEIDNLIFAPGFSTADTVSDISGRGVGMDVVKRSIQALGGRITIQSRPGEGSTFTLSLPLTLAVLDGMVVTVGEQTLVVPITVIVETLQPKAGDIRLLGPAGAVVSVRGAYVPLIDVGVSLGWPTNAAADTGVTILVESGPGEMAAMRVDSILGQRQVVIKSLEQNYDQVDGIAAATILGDGRVALILDVDALISRRRRAATAATPTQPFALAS